MAEAASESIAKGAVESRWQRRCFYLFILLSLIGVVLSAIPEGKARDPLAWDLLMVSGFLTLVAGIFVARDARPKMEGSLSRLTDRGLLEVPGNEVKELEAKLEERASIFIRVGGPAAALAILIAFLVLISKNWGSPRGDGLLRLGIFETAWAYVVGRYLGRMAAYGMLGRFLKKEGVSVRVSPGHIDGAAGLKPIGDFSFFQAMVVAIPALFLAVWWLIIPIWPDPSFGPRYLEWRQPYLWLLALAITVEILAFVVPMWSFHVLMRQEQGRLFKKADALSESIAGIKARLAGSNTNQERNELTEQLAFKTKQYWDIEQMPTWPLDTRTLRKFTFRNVTLSIPILSEMLGLTGLWSHMARIVSVYFGDLSQ